MGFSRSKLIGSIAVSVMAAGILVVPPAAALGAPGDPVVATIAEIQGTAAASAMVGETVITTGVVTAAYPTGGLQGYTIQTPGTGGTVDPATHTASDGIFVFSSATVGEVTIGDHVQVTGMVSEFHNLTEITVAAGGVAAVPEPAEAVKAVDISWPGADTQRESLESMLYRPPGTLTVTNTYATNQYGEVGLATGGRPLIQPTDAAAPGTAAAAAVAADNAARGVVLDDGATTNFLSAANRSQTPPYVSLTNPIRVGAAAGFIHDVIVDYRNDSWKLNPTSQVTPAATGAYPATFGNDRPAAPDPGSIGAARVKVASFNVLNYFTTLGADLPGCTANLDRDQQPITVQECPGNGPRGAWNAANLKRQQDKIVAAINALDADVVGLMEIENSAKLGDPADEALTTLVGALNTAAGSDVWAANPSSSQLPGVEVQDVITSAIIYKTAAVSRAGDSVALGTASSVGGAFANAREPVGQVFTPMAGGEPFLFVVNHFKSKGAADATGADMDMNDGQGAFNASRVAQAAALAQWVPSVLPIGVTSVLLAGDFNSYTKEDPLQKLYQAGYTDVADQFGVPSSSYSFGGLSGSLDHVLANNPALARSTGADVWGINSGESVALEYSRYNAHGTLFYAPDAYRSSDHDPVVLGLDAVSGTQTVQILGINDFHGRIAANQTEAGAAVLAGAVGQLRAQHSSTVFAAAGDLIGASTFESFIQRDKPTIDALNQAGLQVSAVGNHEFDKGYPDLTKRVMAPFDPATNPLGGADWQYLGANVRGEDGSAALPESWTETFGNVQVGFVGAVTEHLPELVSPAGIAGLTIEKPVEAANREADKLKAAGADIVILLVHEGAATTALADAVDPNSDFGKIVTGVDGNVDAIVSGHTHLSYNHSIPVQSWIDEGRPLTTRPVVSAGQYGANLDQLLFEVNPTTGTVQGVQSKIVPLMTTVPAVPPSTAPTYTANYPADPATAAIVKAAVDSAEVLGAAKLGRLGGPFNRAKVNGPMTPANPTGITENRGGESSLGNLVAEVQRWATADPRFGGAQIALMNPGGLRADMVGSPGSPASYPADLTKKQAANVQPFANTLVNMQLTGAQLKTVLEQQWQPAGSSRPFLKLGTSAGFTYTYNPAAAAGSHISQLWLAGAPIDPAASYSVTVNSFLAAGGDNFGELANGTQRRDTGQVDLQAMVDYLAAKSPVPVDFRQQSVGVSFPTGAPAEYSAGRQVEFSLTSLIFPAISLGTGELRDSEVVVTLPDGTAVGSYPVDGTVGTEIRDEYGTAQVAFVVPAGLPAGPTNLLITGNTTGTTTSVPITIAPPELTMDLSASANGQIYGSSDQVTITATMGDFVDGTVEFRANGAAIGSAPVVGYQAMFELPAATAPGVYSITAVYTGPGSPIPVESGNPVEVTVDKASSQVVLLASTTEFRKGSFFPALLFAGVSLNNGQLPAGTVQIKRDGVVVATIPSSYGLGVYVVPRSLARGAYTFKATFVPSRTDLVNGADSNAVRFQVR